ncbi:MAG: DegT/DnrJ/EryC1/StrS aminotransferase family protein [Anaerolineales bacterium]|nr:DegT/DnrJ/EryC1/StrS aminotransferase family protein [Anaerolineales bacterium]
MFRHLPPTAAPLLMPDWRRLEHANADFKSALEAYLGAHCFLASSGRTALYVLLQTLAAAHPARTEVVMPAYTCPAVAKVAIDVGLRPLFIDISPQTFAFDMAQLAENVTAQTLAVICVHPFGIPQDIGEVMQLARLAGALVIEDAAQAMGARWDGQPVGTHGDFGLFSLGPGKALSTGGGGVLCVNDAAFVQPTADAWRQLKPASQLASGAAWLRYLLLTMAFHPRIWWWAARLGVQRVGNHEASWGYRLTELTAVQSAIGLAGLAHLDKVNEGRRENGRRFWAALQGVPGLQTLPIAETAVPIFLRLPVIIGDTSRSNKLFQTLWQTNIGVGRMYGRTLPQLFSQFAAMPTPGADHLARCLLTLPTHHFMTQSESERILDIFHK